MFINEKLIYKLKKYSLKYKAYIIENNLKKLDSSQKVAFAIVKDLLQKSDSDLRVASLSGKQFVINEKAEMYCKMEYDTVTIVEGNNKTGKHSYEVYLPLKIMNELRNKFNKKSEYHGFVLEKDIMKNIKSNLQTIHEKLNKI